jgi:hypothetical protein
VGIPQLGNLFADGGWHTKVYLSMISLVKGWPQQNVRREVLMVTNGIDRLRGEKPDASRLGPDYGVVYHRPEFSQGFQKCGIRLWFSATELQF